MFKALFVPAVLAISCLLPKVAADDLASEFARPPQSARPWVYWFWLNSNITKTGITADLEAMKRVGIGGALIMEVDQGAPVGQVPFMSSRWREMFRHAIAEAAAAGPGREHEQRRRLERQRRALDPARAIDAGGRLDRDGDHRAQALRGGPATPAGHGRFLPRHRRAGPPQRGRLPHSRL